MEIKLRKLEELKPFIKNPNKHPEKQLKMLEKSIREFGFLDPIQICQEDMIVAGHARYMVATKLGLEYVPTIYHDMPYEKAVAYCISHNQLARLAEEDRELLGELLPIVSDIPDFDFEATGFTQEDYDLLLGDSSISFDEEEAEEEAEQAKKEYINLEKDTITIFHALAGGQLGLINKYNYLCSYLQTDVKNVMGRIKFPNDSLLFLDSGALAGVLKYGSDYVSLETQEKIVKHAEEIGAHWVTMLDIPMIPQVLEPLNKTKEEAYKIHIRNAKAFKDIKTNVRKVFVIQGPEFIDFKRCCMEMKSLISDNDVVAIGTLKTRAGDSETIEKITALVKSYYPNNDIHLFGVTTPETVAKCVKVGATSCDSAAASFATRTGSITIFSNDETGKKSTKNISLSEYCGMDIPISQSRAIWYGSTVMGMLNVSLAIWLEIQKQKAFYESN